MNNLITFFRNFPFFWNFQNSTRTNSDFWPRKSQLFKTANYLFKGSFDGIKFFVLIGFFSFQKFWEFEQFFWHFWTKKLRRFVKRAHCVSGGAFQGKLFSKENISENSGKKSRGTRHLFPKNSLLLLKQFSTFPMELSYGRKKFSLKKSSYFTFSRTFS